MKDLSKKQFEALVQKYGFQREGVLGYYFLVGYGVSWSIWNAGTNRRAQLAYLLKQKDHFLEKRRRLEAIDDRLDTLDAIAGRS